jgi:5-methylcytosine-specific restriction endonuclease McrA
MAVTRLCSVPRCGCYRERGTRCARHAVAHEKRDNARRNRKWQASGANSKAWRKLREQAMRRDDFRCRGCRSRDSLSVHIDPRLKGDHRKAQLKDCITLCLHCHGVVDGARARGAA